MKALIVDDERDARLTIANYLASECPEIEHVVEGESVADGLEKIRLEKPDVVFLDIKMGDGLGFDLLDRLPSINFHLVFTTAYSEFAVRAFRYCAVDYLLKPIDPYELKEAVQRITEREAQEEASKNVDELMQIYSTHQFERIALPGMEEINFVDVDDIIRCHADSNYTEFFLTNERKLIVSSTLKQYEELLPSDQFFRIHQSHLINLRHVDKYLKRYSMVKMSDGSELEVSKRKKPDFLKRMSKGGF